MASSQQLILGQVPATGGGGGAYQISRSLRFNSADSAYLNRTFAANPTTRTKCHWHWIVKRGVLSTDQRMFSGYSGTSGDSTWLIFETTNTFKFNVGGSNGTLVSNAVFRDPSAWYICDLAFDSTQATAADRAKFWVNGVLQTWSGGTVTQNSNHEFALANANNKIGSNWDTSLFFNGYMTEVYWVDGQALTPSSFGQTNSTTGVWEPIAYTGTYGTNGFYLNFSDNSGTTSTTLGKDYSGNGNNWTPNNFSVTAGAGNDSLVDTPTPYGTDTGAGGEVRGNYCTWNSINPIYNTASISVVNGNLEIVKASSTLDWRMLGTFALPTSGKWHWEVTITAASFGDGFTFIGIADTQSAASAFNNGYFYTQTGGKTTAATSGGSAYGATYTVNDVISVGYDADAGTITFYKNGSSQGTAYSSIPNTTVWFPAFSQTGNPSSSTTNWNFGQRPFAYTAPSGFKALVTTNLPDPTVVQGDDYFNTVLYTGNGSTQSITGVGFQPDWVWIKRRSGSVQSHNLTDAVRGTNKSLATNAADAEQNPSLYGQVSAFNSDGFTVASGTSGIGEVNGTSETYVGWNWNAGGSTVTNTAGTISSQVRANTTAGFSVVTYTGNGSSTATVGHGLGAVPSMFIVKSRSNATDWIVYHVSLGNNTIIKLNSAGATFSTDYWQDTTPSSTLLYLNGAVDTEVCANGRTFVAYCFAAVAGYSAFGSYTGNGSADGTFVYTGFKPAFVIVKNTTDSGVNWLMWDNKMNAYNVVTTYLLPNLPNAQFTDLTLDMVSNGFKPRVAGGTGINQSGKNYIYAAFAENPFKYSLAR